MTVVKTDCEYHELENPNECYMFKDFICDNCRQYSPRGKKVVACVGPTQILKTLQSAVLVEILNNPYKKFKKK